MDGEVNLFRQPQEDPKAVIPDRRREIQVNLFAATLLMPEEAIKTEWKRLQGRSLVVPARPW